MDSGTDSPVRICVRPAVGALGTIHQNERYPGYLLTIELRTKTALKSRYSFRCVGSGTSGSKKDPKITATAGPLDRVLRNGEGKLRAFHEVMYELYSSDARGFIASYLMEILKKPPSWFSELKAELQDKAKQVLALEIVAKFCEAAEDFAAFGIAFGAEFYMDVLKTTEVWQKKLPAMERARLQNQQHSNMHGPSGFNSRNVRYNTFPDRSTIKSFPTITADGQS